MSQYANLIATITAAIRTNGVGAITGQLLQTILGAMVNSLGLNYQYAGIATPSTDPGTPDQNVFYIASTAGTYTNFGGLVLADGEIAILKYNGAWSKDSTGAASLEMVNQLGQEIYGLQLGFGKSLIKLGSYTNTPGSSTVINGITFTINTDGSVIADGTATANADFYIYGNSYKSLEQLGLRTNVNYKLYGCPEGGGSNKYRFCIDNDGTSGTRQYIDYGKGRNVIFDTDAGAYKYQIRIYAGQTVSNLLFTPALVEVEGAVKEVIESIQDLFERPYGVKYFCNVIPNISTVNKTLTFYNSVIFANGASHMINQQSLDLSVAPNDIVIVFNVSTNTLSVQNYTYEITKEHIVLYCIRKSSNGDRLKVLSVAGISDITIDGILFGVEQISADIKNLLIDNVIKIKDIPNTTTLNGVTFTNNADGTITVNGTANGTAIFGFSSAYKSPSELGIKIGVDYHLMGCPKGGSNSTYRLNIDNSGAGTTAYNDYGEGADVKISSAEGGYMFRIIVSNGVTVNNLLFAPALVEYQGVIKTQEERIIALENKHNPIEFENNYYYNVHGGIGDVASLEKIANNSYKTAKVACQAGDMFIVNATAGGDSAKAFVFVDSNNTILAPLFATTSFNGVVVAPTNAAYIVISSNNKTLNSFSGQNDVLYDTRARVLKLETKNLDYQAISQFSNNGVFGSFTVRFPGYQDCCPIIISARAKYTTAENKPTIRFISGVYTSIYYTIGDEVDYAIKEWRIPPALFNKDIIIEVSVPNDCNLYITDFSCKRDRVVNMIDVGVRLDAHLGFQGAAPENTMAAYELAAQCSYPACIVNPIANAENEIYCYHEDTPCLFYDGVPTLVALSANEFAALTNEDVEKYRVVGNLGTSKYFNERIPKLADFLYLCAVTGMRPIFSTHPAPTDAQWLIIKELLQTYRLLDKIIIKAFSIDILEKAYSILGDVYGFIYDVNGANAVAYCDDMDNSTLASFNGETGIEYTVANLTKSIVDITLSRGYFCSAWSVGNITGAKYKELIQWGVSEFVDDYNCSVGLNF